MEEEIPHAAEAAAPAPIQRAFNRGGFGEPHPGLLRAPSGGAPLAAPVQRMMSGAFGHDFRSVRVHQDAQAESIHADAFTRGEHLHFRPGLYAPHTPAGLRLLGHELAHVVQQRARRVSVRPGGRIPLNADPRLEGEAERMGARAAAARAPAVAPAPAAASSASAATAPIQPMFSPVGRAAAQPGQQLAAHFRRKIWVRAHGGVLETDHRPKHKPVRGHIWLTREQHEHVQLGMDAVGTYRQWKKANRLVGLQGEHPISQKALGIIATKGRALTTKQHKTAVDKAGMDSPVIPLEPKQHIADTATYGGLQQYVDRVGKQKGKRPEIHALYPHFAAVQAMNLLMRNPDHLLVGASIAFVNKAAKMKMFDLANAAAETHGDPMRGGVTLKPNGETVGAAFDRAQNNALRHLVQIPKPISPRREGQFLTIRQRLQAARPKGSPALALPAAAPAAADGRSMKAKMKAKRKKGPKPN
jgi:hypothetical protein